ncbi:MAG: hypothetical protein HY673_01200 [Chloroflexi bacterium]|nr:hypothetical protein [Chloroflexota bacterium]
MNDENVILSEASVASVVEESFEVGRRTKDPSTALRVTFSEQIQNANVQVSETVPPTAEFRNWRMSEIPGIWNPNIRIGLQFRDWDSGFSLVISFHPCVSLTAGPCYHNTFVSFKKDRLPPFLCIISH